MTETMVRKLNVKNTITFVLMVAVVTLWADLSGRIQFDIPGLLAGLVFVGFLIFIGYLADKSGLARYLGWD